MPTKPDSRKTKAELLAELDALRAQVNNLPPSPAGQVNYSRLIAEYATDLIGVHRLDSTYDYVSPSCRDMLGYAPEDLIGQPAYAFVHPDDIPAAKDFHARILANSEVSTITLRFRHRAGHYLWLESAIRRLTDPAGNLHHIVSISRNITARKRVEDAYRALIEQPPFGLTITQEQHIVYANQALAEMMGRTVEQIMGLTGDEFSSWIDPADLETVLRVQAKLLASEPAPRHLTIRLRHQDGSMRWIELYPHRVVYRNQPAIRCLYIDVNEQRTMEEQLLMLSHAVEQSGSTVMITDTDGNIEYVNPKFVALTGYTLDEVLGENPRILQSGEMSLEFYAHLWDTITAGHEWRGEFQNRKKDGDLYWESASISPIKDSEGTITHYIAVKEDITERKRAEAERETLIEELDAFAHTVAHDLKNPLGLIMGYAEVLISTPPGEMLDENALRTYIGRIAQGATRMNRIVDDLLLFASIRQQNEIPLHTLDMGPIVTEVEAQVAPLLAKAKATLRRPDAWPAARGYAPWVEHVWVNYISNALKYGGQPPEIELGADQKAGGYVSFWVRDNGAGLSHEEQAYVFAPFTRLDQVNVGGYGLGLSIVRRLVERMNGSVGVQSELGQGCRFFFTLPGA